MAQKPAKQEFQFAHIETYARRPAVREKGDRKHSVADILNEAMRLPDNCPHVPNPGEPEVLEGMHPAELLARHDELVASRRIAGKRNKQDVHTLAAAVYSWPELVEYTDRERFARFVQDVLAFHRKHVGPIDGAVVHWDETYPHLHVYTSDMDARRLSPGWCAKREVLAAGGDAKAAGLAYREAMRNWQDLFYAEVGQINGLDRYGPRRQRLTRAQFRAAKAERVAAADRLRDARDAATSAEQTAEQARSRASGAQMRAQLIDARVSQLAAESQTAAAQLAELQAAAGQLSADLAALPRLRERNGTLELLDEAVGWLTRLSQRDELDESAQLLDAIIIAKREGPAGMRALSERVSGYRAAEAETARQLGSQLDYEP